MILPPKKRVGDPILAEDWNAMIEAIIARTPRSGDGLKLSCSSGGFAYAAPPQTSVPFAYPPFGVIGIEKAGAAYKVTIKEGWVIERQPRSTTHPAVKFWSPKVGTVTLSTIPRPQLSMSIGQYAYCRVQTNTKGEVSTNPLIMVGPSVADGVHFYPIDPDASGTDGDYYVKLFLLEADADGNPRVRPYQQSDIEHWAELWTGKNVGPGSRVFKEHEEELNEFLFRSIKQGTGITVTENAEDIEIKTSGWWGDVTIDFTGTSGYTEYVTLRIQGGTIQEVFVRSGAVPGDEATPGVALLSTVDT